MQSAVRDPRLGRCPGGLGDGLARYCQRRSHPAPPCRAIAGSNLTHLGG